MQKKLLILVVVALILIGGVFLIFGKKSGAINQSKTEDLRIVPMSEKEKADKYAWNWDGDTSNWRVYMNDDFGFALRYPEEVFDFRILPVSDGVGIYSEPLLPKEFGLSLTQKGYSRDDYKHQIWMYLNVLKSEKEYYAERDENFIAIPIVFSKKNGRIFGTKSTIVEIKSEYEAFLSKGTCNTNTFTINFDDIKNPNGDVSSYVHVGCDGNDMGRIYKAIYQSIRFF